MPSKWFMCPNEEIIEIEKCLDKCPYGRRCLPRPYLERIGYDREWRGITPSMAGNGPRLIHLKRVKDYVVKPQGRAFAFLGIQTHQQISFHDFNVLTEEKLSDDKMKGIADLLEVDEERDGWYILTDWKTWGSYRVMRALGHYYVDVQTGEFFKSGPRKGKPKTKKEKRIDPAQADIKDVKYQLNRYRMFYEGKKFRISQIQMACVIRDGGVRIAAERGLSNNIEMIEIPIIPDVQVHLFYDTLTQEVEDAFQRPGTVRKCDDWECWGGRRCEGCEVREPCEEMGS